MRHCDINIEDLDTWFLQDIDGFTKRVLKIAKCPVCKQFVVSLKELRVSDKQVFENTLTGNKAESTAKREKKRIVYTLSQHCSYPTGWIYGVNKERHNKYGKVTSVTQYSVGYNSKHKVKIKSFKV